MIHLVPGLFILEPVKIIHLGVKKESLVFITDSNTGKEFTNSTKVVFGGTQVNIPKFENNTNVIMQAELKTKTLHERRRKFHDALVQEALLGYNVKICLFNE